MCDASRALKEGGVPMHPGMKRSIHGIENVKHTGVYNPGDLDIQPKHRETAVSKATFKAFKDSTWELLMKDT